MHEKSRQRLKRFPLLRTGEALYQLEVEQTRGRLIGDGLDER